MNQKDLVKKLANSIENKDFAAKIKKIANEYELRKKLAVMKASPKQVNISVEDMQDLFAVLRANVIFLQYAHWVTKSDTYYGDHILYERLYDESNEELDDFAEKIIPFAGEDSVDPIVVIQKTHQVLSDYSEATKDKEALSKIALNMEQRVLQGLEEVYKSLEDSDELTMGFDDLLQAMHNLHESHIYLLGQRVKGE